MKPPSAAIAFAVACLGILAFSTMDAVVKGLTLAIGTYNTLLFRSFAAAPMAGVPWLLRGTAKPARAVLMLHLERGALAAVTAVLFFWGLARVPMAQAVALTFIAPLLAQGLSVILLGERPGKAAILGSVMGLAGVIVVLAGQARMALGPEAGWGALAVLASACCYAYNIILMRRQAQVADPLEVAFFQNSIVALCLFLAAPWLMIVPDARHVPMILLAAALVTISLSLLSWAYARAEANYLAPVEYTAFIWASFWGYWLFAEHVGLLTICGAGLIVAGCLIAARSPNQPLPERDTVP